VQSPLRPLLAFAAVLALCVGLTLGFTGCGTGAKDVTLLGNQSGRFRIVSAQEFNSNGTRHIIVLFDNQTEKEYLCVMGAGVTEMQRTDQKGTTHTDKDR
jgi:hypothetical protein